MELSLIKEKILKITPNCISNCYFSNKYRLIGAISHYRHKKVFNCNASVGSKINMVFIVYLPQTWNSLKTVYEYSLINPSINSFLVVLPENISISDKKKISSFEYFSSLYQDAIEAYKNGKLFDIKELKPDFVFRQTPYDSVYPKEYSLKNISKYSKTCYVPYNYNFSSFKHLIIEYNEKMLSNLFAIFSESESNYTYCNKQKQLYYHDLNVYYLGFPRFDLIHKIKSNDICNYSIFTWIPRWSVDTNNNDGTSFFSYCDLLIDYFSEHKEISLVIRPHPNMFNYFLNNGIMSSESIKELFERINKYKNISFDNNYDYLVTFENTDILIADMSSINYEFFLLGKPIIYCGEIDDYNKEGLEMAQMYYYVRNNDDMVKELDMLANRVDPLKHKREIISREILNSFPKDSGKRILEACINYYEKR